MDFADLDPESAKSSLKITQRPKKYPEIIYIYLYFYGRALASSGRDLDAPKRGRDAPTPKKRMPGLTPRQSSVRATPGKRKKASVFGDPRNI